MLRLMDELYEGFNVMVDLETMGINSNAVITQIGAVSFNMLDGIRDKFHAHIDMEACVRAGMKIDISTIVWWLKQSSEARAAFSEKGVPPAIALNQFSMWLEDCSLPKQEDVKLWGNGSDFDNVILGNAYDLMGLTRPWKFYNNRCFRTIRDMTQNSAMEAGVEFKRTGVYHNALDDAITQANYLLDLVSREVSL